MSFLRTTPVALLIMDSNCLVFTGPHGISALVAVSPATSYLVLTGWPTEVRDEFLQVSKTLHVPIDVLGLPFEREELAAALRTVR